MPGSPSPENKPSLLLNVPSGALIFANDLRQLTDIPNPDDITSQQSIVEHYASDGIAFIYTADSNPSVYSQDEGLVVGRLNKTTPGTPPITEDDIGQNHGSILSKLRWYCAMDKDLYLSRCAETGLDPEHLVEIEVDVEPGVYLITNEQPTFHDPGFVAISKIKKVDENPPKLIERKAGPAESLVKSQFWHELTSLAEIKRLFPTKDLVLGDLFTVLGCGYNWHGNLVRESSGRIQDPPFKTDFPEDDTDGYVSKMDTSFIPVFPNYQMGIRSHNGLYPTHIKHSPLANAPLKADPYWMAAGMMFLKTALSVDFRLLGDNVDPIDQVKREKAELRDVLSISLDVLCEIAQIRGIDKDGTLDRIFGEIQRAWVENPEPV